MAIGHEYLMKHGEACWNYDQTMDNFVHHDQAVMYDNGSKAVKYFTFNLITEDILNQNDFCCYIMPNFTL